MSKNLETISILDDYLVIDTTDRRVCEMSNPTYERMFRGSRLANEMATLLVEYRERIAELEEQLKNAIVPKFKIGQKVWFVDDIAEEIFLGIVVGFEGSRVYDAPFEFYYRIEYEDGCLITDDFEDKLVFTTKEEALAKLKELKGE